MINTSLPSKSIENIYWEHFSSIKVLHKVGQTSEFHVLLAKPPDMAKCYHQILASTPPIKLSSYFQDQGVCLSTRWKYLKSPGDSRESYH